MENIKEKFAEWGLWSLVEDISDDGDGTGDNLQLTKEGLEAQRMLEQELDKAREEGNEELSEAMIKYLENMIVLVGAFNPMSEVVKARQEGELEAYKGILSKLKQ